MAKDFLTKEISTKIQNLKLILIILVVFVHSHVTTIFFKNTTIVYAPSFFAEIFVNLFSQTIARSAVPLFFVISAYLFFREGTLNLNLYLTKIKSRVKTLIIPFFLWNILILLLLYSVQSIPAFSNYFSQRQWATPKLNPFDILNAILGITRQPILYQFWFLRDLIIFVLFSPIIWFFVHKFPRFMTVLTLVAYFTPIQDMNFEGLVFFILGCILACRKIDFDKISKYKYQLFLLTLLLILIDAILLALFSKNHYPTLIFHRFTVITSILGLWSFVSIIPEKFSKLLTKFSAYSFFIYAFHEPLMNIIRKLFYTIFKPTGDIGLIAYYLITPAVTIFICISVASLFERNLSSLYRILTGERLAK